MDIKKTANLLLNFAIKRIAEIFGLFIFLSGALLLISLITYSPEDPNFIFPKNTKIKNLLGFQGSFISDLFFQSFGFFLNILHPHSYGEFFGVSRSSLEFLGVL